MHGEEVTWTLALPNDWEFTGEPERRAFWEGEATCDRAQKHKEHKGLVLLDPGRMHLVGRNWTWRLTPRVMLGPE